MDLVFIGKVVNTHGIKGEFRIKSDFERKDLVFNVGKSIIIDNNMYEITSYRVHKEYDMVTIKGFNDINQVLGFKGKNVFIDRNSLELGNNDYIYDDLIGCDIILNDEILGHVSDYIMGKNPLIEVIFNEKKYYIPLNGNFILNVDKERMKINVSEETKGLIL